VEVGMFEWFDAKAGKEFGAQLAQFYLQRAAKKHKPKKTKLLEVEQRELLKKLQTQISAFKSKNKLNVYKTAQVGNAFKWQLLDAKLVPNDANELTNWVLHQLK
jgi:hypothetical protein